MAPSSAALRRPPPRKPSAPAGGFARGNAKELVPRPAAIDLEAPADAAVAVAPDNRRGRGAQSNASGRYEPLARVVFDDGWQNLEDLPAFKTTVTVDATRRIITRNESPDISFDRSINPYRGCEHGCIYCFARPTHAYLGLSPGVDFESKLFVKPNAAELLERELSAPNYSPRTIAIGTNTDPYQPIEKQYQVMRRILEVLERFGHPVGIVTKSALVLRDLDILARMAERNLAKVALSVTTLDPKLARVMEPRAATPARRLEALRQLSAAGVPTSVMVAPVIPAINDAEIERILDAAAALGREGGGLRAAAPAARSARLVPRMADGEFPRPLPPCVQAGARHARRQGLRFRLGQANDRGGSGRLDDRPAVRGRLREARPQQGPDQSHHRAFFAAAAGSRAAQFVLKRTEGLACQRRLRA